MALNPFQKINHFPGTWHIGRKDMLHRNLQRMRREKGAHEYYFAPQTFLLPGDWTLLCNELDKNKGQVRGTTPRPPASGVCRRVSRAPSVLSLPSQPPASPRCPIQSWR